MQAYRGNSGTTPLILTSALGGGEWPASCTGKFTSR